MFTTYKSLAVDQLQNSKATHNEEVGKIDSG